MILLLLLINFASAQQEPSEDPIIKYKETTEIDFEALELEGELVKPQGALLLERRGATFNPLIKLRKDFNLEMSDSTKLIK